MKKEKPKEDIEYVIYCRKSTDETSELQKQSIPDQIRACIEYAKREWLKIKEKPKDFSLFESDYEIDRENNEPDIENNRTYRETRSLFIIKEQETGKIPWKRHKWRNLIKLIKKWQINWIISYSPDRQARNMLEAGELIDLLDQNKLKENKEKWKVILSVKYPNFHFDDNAAWKMMLGIWFVFSKQYSDKLSEDIWRWNNSKVESWKAIWRFKHWYIINDNWFHEPNPKFFGLIKEAFEMKLNLVPESIIKDFLNSNWYYREYSDWTRKQIWKNAVTWMLRDDFYYGMFINWDTISDLRETNPYYKPMITAEEFQIIKSRVENNPISITKTKKYDIYEEITPFDNSFIITEDNYHLTFSLPNNKRYFNKIKDASIKGKVLSLKDVVNPNQIIYRCANKSSKYNNLSISVETIDNAIMEKLKWFKIWEKDFQTYVNFTNSRLDDILKSTKEKIASKNLEMWRLKAEKIKYMKDNMSIKKDVEEEKIYEDAKKDYDKKIGFLVKEIEKLNESERNELVELEVFIDVLNNAKSYYEKANYVQKWKIAQILFLNIKIDHEKRLHIQVKPELETLFSPVWYS